MRQLAPLALTSELTTGNARLREAVRARCVRQGLRVGTQGAVVRVPAMFPTVQLVFYADRLPKGFGEASRQFWLSQFDRQMQTIQRSEASIPPRVWLEISPEVLPTYVEALRQGRLAGAQQGLYAKRTLNLLKKVRCSVVPESAECASATEVE